MTFEQFFGKIEDFWDFFRLSKRKSGTSDFCLWTLIICVVVPFAVDATAATFQLSNCRQIESCLKQTEHRMTLFC